MHEQKQREVALWIEKVREGFERYRAIRGVHSIDQQVRVMRQRYALLEILIEVVNDRNFKHRFEGVDARIYKKLSDDSVGVDDATDLADK